MNMKDKPTNNMTLEDAANELGISVENLKSLCNTKLTLDVKNSQSYKTLCFDFYNTNNLDAVCGFFVRNGYKVWIQKPDDIDTSSISPKYYLLVEGIMRNI